MRLAWGIWVFKAAYRWPSFPLLSAVGFLSFGSGVLISAPSSWWTSSGIQLGDPGSRIKWSEAGRKKVKLMWFKDGVLDREAELVNHTLLSHNVGTKCANERRTYTGSRLDSRRNEGQCELWTSFQ